ncbi:MAG: dockerin type I domain-containing protein [Oscillospiraceae bacterium]|jgi:hypothetical protein|nr:dockerin type I domain-containing protein [Oscillospiraceae bacterium]
MFNKTKKFYNTYKANMLKVLSVFFILCIIANILSSTEKAYSETGEYKDWKQADSRWGDKWLCSNSYEDYNMAQIGCAVTSTAMLAVKSGAAFETSFNPGVLCDFLYENKGFDNDGDLIWGKVAGLIPRFRYIRPYNIGSQPKDVLISELSELIDQGYYIVLTVKPDNGHWVAVDRIEGNDVYILDPADNGGKILFDYYYYGNCTTARLFKGPDSVNAPYYTQEEEETVSVNEIISEIDYSMGYTVDDMPIEESDVSVDYDTPVEEETGIANSDVPAEEDTSKSSVSYSENTLPKTTGYYLVNATDNDLNYRSGAGTSYPSLGKLPHNKLLKITEIKGNWGKFQYNDKTCWVSLNYVDRVLLGDIDGNGTVNSKDYTSVILYRANQRTFNARQRILADVNFNGTVDVGDATLLMNVVYKGGKLPE